MAPVPELCGHQAGQLVNGILPLQNPERGPVLIASHGEQESNDFLIAYGDMNGDGVDDAVMVTDCSAGGVGWPSSVHVYTNGNTRLGSIDLADLPGRGGRSGVRSVSISGGTAHIEWTAYRDDDIGCCPTLPMVGDLIWDGKEIVTENVRPK
ncbi:hypothetical protein ACWDTG_25895 [Rhodococcus zopfii]